MKRLIVILFFIHLLTRTAYILLSGFYNNYGLQADSLWLVEFGMKAAEFNFDFELERFVASPLFPVLVGLLKFLFGESWNTMLILLQLFLSALSGVYIYKLGLLLFNKKTALLGSLLYAVFPLTLWFTNTFTQECLFQVTFIFSMYHLFKGIYKSSYFNIILSGIFFSLAYLTKSHILLFSVFIPIIFYHYFKLSKQTLIYTVSFAAIAVLFSIPYGIYTYKKHNQYMLSSNGAGILFYLGNTQAGYRAIVDVPEKNTEDFYKIKNINVTAAYFNGSQSHYDSIVSLPQKERQSAFFQDAFIWIKNNPSKFLELKFYDILFFIMPGVNWQYYKFPAWLFSFLISLPVYVLAYISIYSLIRERRKEVSLILYLFITMFLFSTIWYVQNRFRSITLEPFYLIYAAYTLTKIIERRMPAVNMRLETIAGGMGADSEPESEQNQLALK